MPLELGALAAAYKPIKNNDADPSRRYSCSLCPYATRTEKTIREHIEMGHTTLKPFKCPHCTYSARCETNLLGHLKLHSSTDAQVSGAVAPASAEPEREMPRPTRRPLSNISNDRRSSAVAVVPARSASFHHPPQRRASSAAAAAAAQFSAEKREEVKTEGEKEKRSESLPADSTASAVKRRRSSRTEKKQGKETTSELSRKRSKEKEGKDGEKIEKEDEAEIETPSIGRRLSSGRMGDGNLEGSADEEEEKEEKSKGISSVRREEEVKNEEEPQPAETREVKRRGRKNADEKREEVKEEKRPIRQVRASAGKSAEEKEEVKAEEKEEERPIRQARVSAGKKIKEEKEGAVEEGRIRASEPRKCRKSSVEETEGETPKKKRGRPSFAELEQRARREAEKGNTVTVEPKVEADQPVQKKKKEEKEEKVAQPVEGEEKVKKEEDEIQDFSSLDAAIAEAEANAARERTRPVMPLGKREKMIEKAENGGEETGPSARKRVHFAPLPEKHHATRMPAKRRKKEGEREGDAMRSSATKVARDFTSFFSSFDTPTSARSISSPDRSGRRATIIEAMKARASQLEQQGDEEMAEEEKERKDKKEIRLSLCVTPFESPKKPLVDEFACDDEMEKRRSTVEVPPTPVKPPRKTPAKSRKPINATVPPRSTVSPIDGGRKKTGKAAPAKNSRETAAKAKAAAAAARKREQARAARLRRLKRDLARRLEKSADRWNVAARAEVEEEDRYWRTTTEVTALEQAEWAGERLFGWAEIHNARRKMAMDVEPVVREGEKRAESLHSISTSSYLARTVVLKQRSEVDGIVRTVKSFDRSRSPPLDWSYEEKETEEALHPTVSSVFVPGGELRCI